MKKILLILLFNTLLFSQEKINKHEAQIWLGYMSSVKLNEDFSLWNDFHFAFDNFFISRHGITYNIKEQITITGGYAWGFLSTNYSNKLIRNEQRPWIQTMFIPNNISKNWQMQHRIRYDARFREKIVNSEIINGQYIFNHRLRYMFNIRKTLDGENFNSKSLFLSLNNEILINFENKITKNNLDQFRTSLLLGKTFENITFQLGYMYRFVPQNTINTYKHYHGLILWVSHNFKSNQNTDQIIRAE